MFVIFILFILDLNSSQRANFKRHGILELAPPKNKESELGLFIYRKMWVSFAVEFYSCFALAYTNKRGHITKPTHMLSTTE